MIDAAIPHKPNPILEGLKRNKVWLASIAILILLAILSPAQARFRLGFTLDALLHTAPFLILSIAIAAWAGATGRTA